MDEKEMTDLIYDALMMNDHEPHFDLCKVEDPVCERKRGWITFEYGDSVVFINVKCVVR